MYDESRAVDRLLNAYIEFAQEQDLALQTACYARLMSTMSRLGLTVENSGGLHSTVQQELGASIDKLLHYSADHNAVTSTAVQSFSIALPEKALDLALKLNTSPRHDNALLDIVKHAVNVPVHRLDAEYLNRVIEHIHNVLCSC